MVFLCVFIFICLSFLSIVYSVYEFNNDNNNTVGKVDIETVLNARIIYIYTTLFTTNGRKQKEKKEKKKRT